jgi:hypothetical protein
VEEIVECLPPVFYVMDVDCFVLFPESLSDYVCLELVIINKKYVHRFTGLFIHGKGYDGGMLLLFSSSGASCARWVHARGVIGKGKNMFEIRVLIR